jgi:hypothetical protein
MHRRDLRPQPFFRGTELLRLMTMIVMLVVLYLIIDRARQPSMWTWFARADGKSVAGENGEPSDADRLAALNAPPLVDSARKPIADVVAPAAKPAPEKPAAPAPKATEPDATVPEATAPKATVPEATEPQTTEPQTTEPQTTEPKAVEKPAEQKPADQKPAEQKPADDANEDFPLYVDPIEREALKANLETVRDLEDSVNAVEMPAYWRLVNWSREPVEGMQKRAVRGLRMNDFIQHANDHRGQLVELKLHARRILVAPAPPGDDKPEGDDKIYEIIAFTDESQGWIYWIVTSELPPGLKTGNDVDFVITLYGFLLKIQKYLPGDAAADSLGFKAPLLIGRVTLDKPPVIPGEETPLWAWWLLAAVAVALALTVFGWMMASGRHRGLAGGVAAPSDRPFDEWLAQPVLGGGDGSRETHGQESDEAGMNFNIVGNNSAPFPRNSSSDASGGPMTSSPGDSAGDAGKPHGSG